MGISLSILLIAVGAILAWAVNAETSGIDLQVAGIILVVVGAIGFVASLIFWSSWGGFGNRDAAGRTQRSSSGIALLATTKSKTRRTKCLFGLGYSSSCCWFFC